MNKKLLFIPILAALAVGLPVSFGAVVPQALDEVGIQFEGINQYLLNLESRVLFLENVVYSVQGSQGPQGEKGDQGSSTVFSKYATTNTLIGVERFTNTESSTVNGVITEIVVDNIVPVGAPTRGTDAIHARALLNDIEIGSCVIPQGEQICIINPNTSISKFDQVVMGLNVVHSGLSGGSSSGVNSQNGWVSIDY